MDQQKLNTTIIYVLAISGLLCCCFGGLGFIPSAIAFYIANSKLKAAELNPEDYDTLSVKTMNTAKTVALVILIINITYFIMTIYRIYTVGWDEIMIQSQEVMEQWQEN